MRIEDHPLYELLTRLDAVKYEHLGEPNERDDATADITRTFEALRIDHIDAFLDHASAYARQAVDRLLASFGTPLRSDVLEGAIASLWLDGVACGVMAERVRMEADDG